MAMAALAPGDPSRLGDYWIAGRLGEGGQGVVYEAYDGAGRRVAVKALRLNPNGGADGGVDLRGRFAREAAAARRVSSFCTARVIAAELEGAQPYIVSEFVGGPSLRRAVERSGPYGPDDLYRLATGIATALTAIHEASVIHRDLKPDNVLIGPDGPRVIDFGIARTADMSLTTTGHVAGTPAFMAPESVLGQRAGPAVDIWAWGAVTVFAATGREPFAKDAAGGIAKDTADFGGNNVAALLHRILAADPDVSMLEEPLRGLVAEAMAKDPRARPSAPALLMRLLGQAGTGRPGGTALLLAEGSRAAEALRPEVAPPSLAARAEQIYAGLGAADQAVVPQILLRMVTPGEGADDMPRKVHAEELLDGVVDPATADRVVSGFARAELVVRERDTMSLASAALLRAWPRLREWIEADRPGLRVHRQLNEAARSWDHHGRRPGDLYQGTSLDNALGWAATGRHHVTLNLLENAFLNASAALGRVRARRRRQLTGALAVLVAVALASTGVAVDQKGAAERQKVAAERQRDTAVARRTAALADSLRSADPATAMALSVVAWRLAGVSEARAALYSSLAQHDRDVSLPPPVTAGARFDLSGDGRTLAVADQGRAVLWDVVHHRRVGGVDGIGDAVRAVALSADARLLGVSGDGGLRVWDLVSGTPLGPAFGDGAWQIEFGPGGRLLAAVAPGYRGQVWDARTGAKVLEVRDERIEGVTVYGRIAAATFRDGGFRLWELAGPRRLAAPGGGRGEAVAVSPDGRTLAVSHAGDVRFWDLSSGRRRGAVLEGAAAAWLAYSDDGRFIMTYDHKGIGLWSVDGGRPLVYSTLTDTSGMPAIKMGAGNRVLRYLLGGGRVATLDVGASGRPLTLAPLIMSAAFAPGARALAVQTGRDLELWDAVAGRRLGPLLRSPPAEALAFSPDGRLLAAGTAEPTASTAEQAAGSASSSAGTAEPAGRTAEPAAAVLVWDVPGRRRIGTIAVPGATSVGGLAFSGHMLAIAPFTDDWRPVRLWDATGRVQTRVLGHDGMDVMTFSPDGRVLAIGGRSSALVDLATGMVTDRPFGPSLDGVRSVAFSPDGSTVATGFHELGADLWDAAGHRPLGRLAPDQGQFDDVVAIAFSPEGRLIATGGTSGNVRLWDAETHVPLGLPYTTHTGPVLALSFGADGRDLYSVGEDGTLQRYTADPAWAAAAVCERAGASLSEDDWRRLIPEVPYRKVC